MKALNRIKSHESLLGVVYGIGAFGLWGLLPIYWKLLQQVSASEILVHRIFWSFIFLSALVLARDGWEDFKNVLHSPKNRLVLLLSAICITANWFTYIFSVVSGHIIEASLGYYITPLFSILLGLLVLRERMNSRQYFSLALATVGVLILTLRYGRIPWIALILTLTFGCYGLLKKLAQLDSLISLTIETLLVAPFCLGFMLFNSAQGNAAFGRGDSLSLTLLLIFGGVVTAIPLLWFAQAAKRIPLSQVGFLQYLSPTISLLLGIFVYHETFTSTHLFSFGCIWVALIIYTLSSMGGKPKLHASQSRA